MNSRQLRCFIALANTLNFTTVAQELHLTQPAISYNIASLEKELGFALFVRAHNSVRLTALGQSFYHDAAPLLTDLTHTITQHQRLAAQYSATLTIGYSDSLRERASFPLAIKNFHAHHPEVQVTLLRTDFYHEVDALLAQHIDLALTGDDALAQAPGLQFDQLLAGQFGVLVPTDSPWQDPIALAQLDGHTLISYDDLHALPKLSALNAALHRACPHSLFLSGSGGGMLTTMAQAELGLAVVPSFVTVPTAGVRFVPLIYPVATNYGAISLTQNQSPALHAWLTALQAVITI